jgi:hypothetical protein
VNRSASMRSAFLAVLCVVIAGCGGGGGGGAPAAPAPAPSVTTGPLAIATSTRAGSGALPAAAANVLPISFDRGVRGTAFNSPFVTVTVCTPGGSACRSIDHVLLDTGSYGLRLAAAALPADVSLPLQRTADGAPVGECAHFASGFAWGSVRTADVQLGDKTIAGLPVQLFGDRDAAFATTPAKCSNTGSDLGARLDANGVLGVGMQRQDCGSGCVAATAPPAIYFQCPETGCTPTLRPLNAQVVNPVASLAEDNNGFAVVLQQVPSGGVDVLRGALVLGIGTQANNQIGTAQAISADKRGLLSASYKGRTVPVFPDTGANGLFLPDNDLPTCGDFFCPAQPVTVTASMQASTSAQRAVDLSLESISGLPAGTVAASIGGKDPAMLTLGLPFFFGRTVFVALQDADTPAGRGPYLGF